MYIKFTHVNNLCDLFDNFKIVGSSKRLIRRTNDDQVLPMSLASHSSIYSPSFSGKAIILGPVKVVVKSSRTSWDLVVQLNTLPFLVRSLRGRILYDLIKRLL